ncbi:UBX domain-containing protein 4 [Colias croceus]|uniref:UBX domain-containing protein 4 n=1 Tax=Colias crocea TaxID=72248 RepID=UPI001E27EB33|nr:UBX domain-containing protein 4 [Colias croceus]
MHWFGGTIAEAVTLSKQKNAIFVVFVEGDNDQSKELAATIDDPAVLKHLANENNFLAIKLTSGSENYTYFAQIYQFVPVPSLFFIGRNGTPLEVVCAGVQATNLAERIDRILEEHYKGTKTTVQPSTSGQNIKQQTTSLLQSEAAVTVATKPEASSSSESVKSPEVLSHEKPETSEPPPKVPKTTHHEVTRSGAEYDVVCDGDVCTRVPKDNANAPGPSGVDANKTVETSSSDISAEEKMERAKELIEARRREKAEKEKELEKQKELERRATGQGVAELKRWQADQEMKQIQEERKREKLENDLARQRILEQIAQDRAERRARDLPQPPPVQQVPHATVGDGTTRARVQFKLSDGGSHTVHFDTNTTLAEVHRYVADNLQMSPTSFSLWTAFPRQELTADTATLRELQLVPSAALLVLPRRSPPPANRPAPVASLISFFTQLFTSLILDPSYQIYTWLRGRLFATPRVRGPSVGPTSPTTPTGTGPSGSNVGNIGPNGIRRRGNIHRLTGDRPGDDDNNTWNGNSTQQM